MCHKSASAGADCLSPVPPPEAVPGGKVSEMVLHGEHAVFRRNDSRLCADATVRAVRLLLVIDTARCRAVVEHDSDDQFLSKCPI